MIVSIIQEKVEASSLEQIAAETTGFWGFPNNARLKTKTLKKNLRQQPQSIGEQIEMFFHLSHHTKA